MIDTDKMDDLARLYRLFVMVPEGPGTDQRHAQKSQITRRGKQINSEAAGTEAGDGDGDVAGSAEERRGKGKARVGAQSMSLALKWVQDILDLKDKFDHVWRWALCCDRDLETAIDEVCGPRSCCAGLLTRRFICRPSSMSSTSTKKSPEFVSLFIDENLKKGLKGVSTNHTPAPAPL